MPLIPGQLLNQRYRVVKLLGQGGFGAVYRAWDVNMERPLALKENLDTTPQAQRQFKREAQFLFDLTHPNLPKVIDHFVIPNQGQYLVMEYVEGQDLGEMLRWEGGPLPEASVIGWAWQVCDALEYLHLHIPPIIHRDIKPANIKITPEGRAMLVDFGIAKVFDPVLSTTVGARAITPGYSPQEQYGAGTTDARSDIYALGATLYHLLTGEKPPESIQRSLGAALPRPSGLTPAISPQTEDAILTSMHPLPGERFQSVKDLKAALPSPGAFVQPPPKARTQAALAQKPPAQQPFVPAPANQPGRAARPAPLTSGRRLSGIWLAGGVLALVVLALGCALGGLWLRDYFTQGTTEAAIPTTAVVSQVGAASTATWLAANAATNTPSATLLPMTMPDVDMALIPAGSFQMGNDNAISDQKPVHLVYVDAFYMDVYEVTNRHYAACVDAGACEPPGCEYFGDPANIDHPVVCVDWEQANTFCGWRGTRLPTEAEWERAARGGLEGALYPWGNEEPLCQNGAFNGARFDDNGGCDDIGAAPVGSYGPNGYGLYDMAGNVWEWLSDWYREDYYAISPSENPNGPVSGEYRVLRGGSWDHDRDYLRVTQRGWGDPTYSNAIRGFRCVRDP